MPREGRPLEPWWDCIRGKRRAADYAIEFRTLAAERGWNQSTLMDAFLHSLSRTRKDQLAPLDLPEELDSLIAFTIKIDKHIAEREKERFRYSFSASDRRGVPGALPAPSGRRPEVPSFPPATPAPTKGPEEPMQLGRTQLTRVERERRAREVRRFYCRHFGHFTARCPVKGGAHQ